MWMLWLIAAFIVILIGLAIASLRQPWTQEAFPDPTRPPKPPKPPLPPQPPQPKPEEEIDPSPDFPKSDFSDLASEVETDYTHLRDCLAAENYKEADVETRRVMVSVARAVENDRLKSTSIDRFPCTDLRTLDRLWLHYSEGRFGFSVQQRIYDEVGQNYEAFGDLVGWRKDGQWLNYHHLSFDRQAPMGHLPRISWVQVFGYSGWKPALLAQKCLDCNL